MFSDIKDSVSGNKIVIAKGPDSAFDDLKGLPYLVRQQLIEIIRTELRLYPRPPDEGYVAPGWLFRRGLSRRQKASLERNPDSVEPTGSQAWDYLIIYRGLRRTELAEYGSGFYVYRILSNAEFAGMAIALLQPRSRHRLAG